MMKYLLHILIISFVFILVPTVHVASYAGETYEEYSKRIDNERAIDNAKKEVRNNPDDEWAHFNLGYAYNESGKYEEAIFSYKQAIRIKPDFATAYHNLGVAYTRNRSWKSGDKALEKAVVLYKKIIRANPEDVRIQNNLGLAYLSLNDRDSALEQYKILKKLNTKLANKLFDKIYRK